jgi:outer membrane lipoprotein-sorting protein
MKIINVLTVSALLAITAFTEASSEFDSKTVGYNIAVKMDQHDSGWIDEQASSTMTLRTASGREVTRMMRTRSLEVENDGDKSLVIFDTPKDVKGTAVLTYSHKKGNDDQWFYLPALRRVKRISSANRSGPFMGSEFAYEDISPEEVERYRYDYIDEQPCAEALICYVIARYPVDKHSGYTKQVVKIDKTHYRIHEINYFDRKGEKVKTLQRTQYKQYQGKFWRALRWDMQNHLTGKSTTVVWNDYQLNQGLSDKGFNKNVLKRLK